MPKAHGSNKRAKMRIEAPGRPPKSWWDKMEKEVKEGNPDYSKSQVRKTIGDIWYNEISQYKRDKLTKKYEGAMRGSQTNRSKRRTATGLRRKSYDPDIEDYLYDDSAPQSLRSLLTYVVYKLLHFTTEEMRGLPDTSTVPDKVFDMGMEELKKHGITSIRQFKELYMEDSETASRLLESARDTVLLAHDQDVPSPLDYSEEFNEYLDEGSYKIPNASNRVSGERVSGERVYVTNITAANFPNLFSSDTRKWIELQTRNLASNMGPISSPEQAVAFVNDAAEQVMAQISDAVSDEVTKIIEQEKDNILKEIVTEDTTFEQEVMAPAPQMPMELGDEAAPAPVAAAYMPHALRIAFEKSANPAEQSLALVKLDPTFLAHLDELEEAADNVDNLAEWVKDYVVGRGLIDQTVADQADWLEPTKMLTSGSFKRKKVAQLEDVRERVMSYLENVPPGISVSVYLGELDIPEDQVIAAMQQLEDAGEITVHENDGIHAYIVSRPWKEGETAWVNVYETTRHYGGPEEGGWWYNWNSLEEAVPVGSQEEAETVKRELEEKFGEGQGDISSVLGGHEIAVYIESEKGQSESTEEPRYD